jgi:hypothetical protein
MLVLYLTVKVYSPILGEIAKNIYEGPINNFKIIIEFFQNFLSFFKRLI